MADEEDGFVSADEGARSEAYNGTIPSDEEEEEQEPSNETAETTTENVANEQDGDEDYESSSDSSGEAEIVGTKKAPPKKKSSFWEDSTDEESDDKPLKSSNWRSPHKNKGQINRYGTGSSAAPGTQTASSVARAKSSAGMFNESEDEDEVPVR